MRKRSSLLSTNTSLRSQCAPKDAWAVLRQGQLEQQKAERMLSWPATKPFKTNQTNWKSHLFSCFLYALKTSPLEGFPFNRLSLAGRDITAVTDILWDLQLSRIKFLLEKTHDLKIPEVLSYSRSKSSSAAKRAQGESPASDVPAFLRATSEEKREKLADVHALRALRRS